MEIIKLFSFIILLPLCANAQIVGPSSNASDGSKVSKSGDTMTGLLTLNGSSLTVTGGYIQTDPGYGLIFGPNQNARYDGNGTTGSTNLRMITAGAVRARMENDGNMTFYSTVTVQGNAFSVGTSTLVVSNGGVSIGGTLYTNLPGYSGKVGIGTTAPARNLSVSGGSGSGVIQVTNDTGGVASGDGGYLLHDGTHMLIGNQEVGDATMFVRNTTDQSIKLTTLGAGANNASLTLKVSATTGGALCLNASNVLSKCTSAVDASGNCTCP